MSGRISQFSRPRVLLSFDVEEFDIPLEYGHPIREFDQFRIGGTGWERTLHLLDELQIRSTLFITAAIAERRPDLLRWSVASGHEIASHSYFHGRFEPEDLRKSRETLERLSGQSVCGFRMPRMAPVDGAALRDAGYTYSSSTNPIWLPGRYNKFFAPRTPYMNSGVLEIPLSATPVFRWPLFWLAFKNQPRWLTRCTTRFTLASDGYAALYFHPWELMECTGFNLPWAVSAMSGESMAVALREHLRWLNARCGFALYRELAMNMAPRSELA